MILPQSTTLRFASVLSHSPNRRISGSATSLLRPNSPFGRTSDMRRPLYEMLATGKIFKVWRIIVIMKLPENILDIQFVKKHKIISIILAYFVIGIIRVVTGYLHNIIIGKQIVFSPFIGIPLGAPFWPMMIYADLKHIGVMPQDVLTLISIFIFIIIFVKNWTSR